MGGAARKGRLHPIRAGGDQHLAAHHLQQATLIIEADIDRAVGVEHDFAAVGQSDATALTDGGLIIGAPCLPSWAALQGPCTGGRHGHDRRLTRTFVTTRRVEATQPGISIPETPRS